jgi:hypothetical protein
MVNWTERRKNYHTHFKEVRRDKKRRFKTTQHFTTLYYNIRY